MNGFVSSWQHHLNPTLLKEKWTNEENKRVFDLQGQHGSKWKEIAEFFPHRTDNDIKNQFFSIIRKCLRKVSKVAGINIGSQVINNIKPKILTEFLNIPVWGESKLFPLQCVQSFKMRDLLRNFAFNKISENCPTLESQDKEIIYQNILKMQSMKLFNQRVLHS